jgi:hypothetical protein
MDGSTAARMAMSSHGEQCLVFRCEGWYAMG